MVNKVFIILLILAGLSSCDLFTTRQPEEPDTGSSIYMPPTDASKVIFNLTNAIIEKNADNYEKCFSNPDSVNSGFQFIPSAEAIAAYSGTFETWDIDSEVNAFRSMFSKLNEETSPIIILPLYSDVPYGPDSVLYTADYIIEINHSIINIPTKFSGTAQMTIIKDNSGLYSISTWYDTDPPVEDSTKSWSFLKALFYN